MGCQTHPGEHKSGIILPGCGDWFSYPFTYIEDLIREGESLRSLANKNWGRNRIGWCVRCVWYLIEWYLVSFRVCHHRVNLHSPWPQFLSSVYCNVSRDASFPSTLLFYVSGSGRGSGGVLEKKIVTNAKTKIPSKHARVKWRYSDSHMFTKPLMPCRLSRDRWLYLNSLVPNVFRRTGGNKEGRASSPPMCDTVNINLPNRCPAAQEWYGLRFPQEEFEVGARLSWWSIRSIYACRIVQRWRTSSLF